MLKVQWCIFLRIFRDQGGGGVERTIGHEKASFFIIFYTFHPKISLFCLFFKRGEGYDFQEHMHHRKD